MFCGSIALFALQYNCNVVKLFAPKMMVNEEKGLRIERVDDKTVKCYLSLDELEAYQIDYKDFLSRTPKAKEVVQEIMEQAAAQVGYKPPQFAFDLQIMMLPDQGMVLTFSEKDPLDSKEGKAFLDYIKEIQKEVVEKLAPGLKEKPAAKVKESPEPAPKPERAVFMFDSIGRIIELAKVLPKNLRVDTALYEMDGAYYLGLNKGRASYDRYSRICICAMEYGRIYGATEDAVMYVEEHGNCIMAEKVLNLLQKS